jgi:hypothetical protein
MRPSVSCEGPQWRQSEDLALPRDFAYFSSHDKESVNIDEI